MDNNSSVFRDPLLTNELQKKYGDEQVLSIPTFLVEDIDDKFVPRASADKLIDRLQQNSKYILRAIAEQNSIMQQIIPYVVITCPERKEAPYFVYKRISGEERLKDNWSLGAGGHINPVDGINNAVSNCIQRELDEEIYYEPICSPIFLGTMRNVTSSLNDHLGLVYQQPVKTAKVKETDKMVGFWCSFQDLFDNYDKFEAWGKYLIDHWYVSQKNVEDSNQMFF